MLTENFFDSDGIRLHYIDYRGVGRPLVLLAGLGGTAQLFRGLAPRLAERFRVVALTRRGHGRSQRPEAGYELDTLVNDIRRFLDELGVERAVLAGHSFAGIEIPRFAIRYPERVEAIVYMDAGYVLLEPQPNPAENPALQALDLVPRPEDLGSTRAYVSFSKRSRPDLASIWCEAIEVDRLEDLTMDGERVVLDGHGAKVTAQMFGALGPHRDPAYGEVNARTLAIVLGGQTNPFLPPDTPEVLERSANTYYVEKFRPWLQRRTGLFREAAPNARIVELDTSNHTLFVAKEDETVEAIFDFLG
ncbi:MAG: alpha/beta hydrolase [Chloroflexi bacterium]|nr:alpha/beta hydrolase [Chloroflexota bacterium]